MKSWNKIIILMLFVLYLYVLLRVILFKYAPIDVSFLWQQLQKAVENPEYVQHRLQSGNLTAFKTIKRSLHNLSSKHTFMNLIGNIVIFVPNGIFVSLLTKYKFIVAVISSFGISLALECSQVLFSMGTFDVDDLILNVSGGILGYIAFQVIRLIYKGLK